MTRWDGGGAALAPAEEEGKGREEPPVERRSPVPCCALPSPSLSSALSARLGPLAPPGDREGLGLRRRLRAGGGRGGRTLAAAAGPLSPSIPRRCGRAAPVSVCLAALPRVPEVNACGASLAASSLRCSLLVETPSLEPSQTHLAAFLCHLLRVTVPWQGRRAR